MSSIRDDIALIVKAALYDDAWHGHESGPGGLDDDDLSGIALTVTRRLLERGVIRTDGLSTN